MGALLYVCRCWPQKSCVYALEGEYGAENRGLLCVDANGIDGSELSEGAGGRNDDGISFGRE